MTRRSNHTANSTEVSRNTKISTALMMTIQIESPASEYSKRSVHVVEAVRRGGGAAASECSCGRSLHDDGVSRSGAELIGDPRARRLRRHPHHAVDHALGDDDGQVKRRRAVAGDRHDAAQRELLRGGWRDPRDRDPAGSREVRLSVLKRALVDELVPRRRARARPLAGAVALGAATAGAAGRSLGAAAGKRREFGARPPRRSPCRARRPSRGQAGRARGDRTSRRWGSPWRRPRRRPSQLTNVPDFSDGGATGKHHVGGLGHRACGAPRGSP